MKPKTITFTRAKLDELKNAYAMAKRRGADQFELDGHPLIMAYAKYLIEYLEQNFNNHKKVDNIQEPL